MSNWINDPAELAARLAMAPPRVGLDTEFVRERTELSKAKASFTQDYKFTNPVTKKDEPKQMYCERLEDTVVCGGIYKH